MIIYTLLLYGVSILLVVASAYVGYVGFKIYIDQVIRDRDEVVRDR